MERRGRIPSLARTSRFPPWINLRRGSVVLRHSPVPRQSTRDQWIDLECDSTVSPLSHDPKDR
jgi:hypothetical protein